VKKETVSVRLFAMAVVTVFFAVAVVTVFSSHAPHLGALWCHRVKV
jgi:hypothetical protein